MSRVKNPGCLYKKDVILNEAQRSEESRRPALRRCSQHSLVSPTQAKRMSWNGTKRRLAWGTILWIFLRVGVSVFRSVRRALPPRTRTKCPPAALRFGPIHQPCGIKGCVRYPDWSGVQTEKGWQECGAECQIRSGECLVSALSHVSKASVKSRYMVYKVSRHMLYTFDSGCGASIQRSTIVERWIDG